MRSVKLAWLPIRSKSHTPRLFFSNSSSILYANWAITLLKVKYDSKRETTQNFRQLPRFFAWVQNINVRRSSSPTLKRTAMTT